MKQLYEEATLVKYTRELWYIHVTLGTEIEFEDLEQWMETEFDGIVAYCERNKTGAGRPYKCLSMLTGIALKAGNMPLFWKYKAAAREHGL